MIWVIKVSKETRDLACLSPKTGLFPGANCMQSNDYLRSYMRFN